MPSTREEFELWMAATKAYKSGDVSAAIDKFRRVGNYSRIIFNIGMIYSRAGDHEAADSMYIEALKLDSYLAVAHLQKGYAHFMLGEYSDSLKCFSKCIELLLDNDYIDYQQLGLDFKLYRCEVLFNMGMCYLQLGDKARAGQEVKEAGKLAKTAEQKNVISSVSRTRNDISLFTVPSTALFEVPPEKAKNLFKKDFLGEGKVVVDVGEKVTDGGFQGFRGAVMLDPELEKAENATLVRKKTQKKEAAPKIEINTLTRSATTSRRDPPRELERRPSSPAVLGRGLEYKDRQQPSRSATNNTQAKKSFSRKSSLPQNRPTQRDYDPLPSRNSPREMDSPRGSPRTNKPLPPRDDEYQPSLSANSDSRNDSGYDDNASRRRQTTQKRSNDEFKVKVHAEKSTVVVYVPKDCDLDTFMDIVQQKLKFQSPPTLAYIDEEDKDTYISIVDEDDLDLLLTSGNSVLHVYVQKEGILDYY
ncbi:hypothetical protein EDD86DRAFT_196399 [Gorgonomyces haynaldii]|nr:hypothetical protein EDD86DRAFT_196399 [Gorgonomyces haynaldii]